MSVRRTLRAAVPLAIGMALAMAAITPAAAQSGEGVTLVTAHDYYFEGLPTSVPLGTELAFTNEGAEFHELALARKNDGVTETWEELLALPEEESLAKVTVMAPLFADAGAAAEGTILLEQEGEYLAICFIPQGTSGTIELPDPNASPDPNAPAPAGLGEGAPHFLLGMRQEFIVTAPDTTPGPLPETPPSMAPMTMPEGSPTPEDSPTAG
jgi:plastocyanin